MSAKAHWPRWQGQRLVQLVLSLLALAASQFVAPISASAITIQISPDGLALSPAGPYSAARNLPVGSVVATASSSITATDIGALGCAITALMLSGSPANGNTFTTGVAGLGVNLYYLQGATRQQITPSLQASISVNLSAPGSVTSIVAEMVVTGPISSGTLSSMPSISVAFASVGLGCGVLNLALKTYTVTATNGTVAALSCQVTNPNISVTLPTVSTRQLAASGNTAGATAFNVGLNCANAGTNVYVTFTDATTPGNRTSTLSLKGTSTATNTGLQILRSDGTPVLFGPDLASSGTINQWLVGPSTAVSGIPLKVQYIATGQAGAGSVSAAATFTMSYQ